MKRKFTNAIRIFIFISIILSIIAGCGKKTDIFNSISIDTKKLAPVTLTFYVPGEEKQDTKEVLDKVAENSNLKIKLNFKWFSYSTYDESIKTAISSNEPFDAFLCGSPNQGTINFIDMFRNGKIKDVTSLLPKYAPAIINQLSTEDFDATRVDGKIIAVPSIFPQAKCIIVTVRKDLADKYNISSIKTFEDYELLLKKIKENGENIIPGSINWNNYNLFAGAYDYVVLDYSQNLVYKWDDPEMRIIPWGQTPEFMKMINLNSKWNKNGYTVPANVQTNDIASQMYISNFFIEGTIASDTKNDENKKVYNCYVLYKDKKTQRISPIGINNINGAIAFNSTSINTERALMFLNWMQSSQKNYDLFNYGIKDRHYILKGERIGVPEGANIDAYRGGSANSAFINISYERLPADNNSISDSFFKNHIQFIKSRTKYAPHEGFYPDYKNIQSYCDRRSQIYQAEISTAMSNGSNDTNQINSIIEELKNAGTDKIVREIQKQLIKWKAQQNK